MRPSPLGFRFFGVVCFALLALMSLGAPPAAAQQIQVTAADPPTSEQGTVNLSVRITGKGFKSDAQANWFVTGTTNPGGVTVNSTAFVSSTELTANITIADDAEIANFDIVVQSGGRTGKGTELFRVTAKNNQPVCTVEPPPAGISLVGTLNDGIPTYYTRLGTGVRAQPMVLGGVNVLVVLVNKNSQDVSAGDPTWEIFFVDSVTGQVLDGTIIGSNTQPQPHITIGQAVGTRMIAGGDVNADGIPDFALGNPSGNAAFALVGSMTGGVVSYQLFPLTPTGTYAGVGSATAMGDLDGVSGDEIAVGATGGGSGRNAVVGKVFIFKYTGSGFSVIQTVANPQPNSKKDDYFGSGLAIADVAGSTSPDLLVGAPNTIINGLTGAGRVFVFPGPVSGSNYLTFSTGVKDDRFGSKMVAGDVDGGFSDFAASTLGDTTVADIRALVFTGLVVNNQAPSFVLRPEPGLSNGWATTVPDIQDLNGDGRGDFLVGVPSDGGCGGLAYLYLSSPLGGALTTRLTIRNPVIGQEFEGFGWAVSAGPGSRLFFISNHGADINGVFSAGQVYIYRVD